MSSTLLLMILVSFSILMFFSFFGLIVAFKEDIRHRSKLESSQINRELKLAAVRANEVSEQEKRRMFETWYKSKVI